MLESPSRAPGHRPSAEEDPLHAWLWKCRIEGERDGLLAGKTVSFKDHIAVAGVPLTFNTYALDGFIPDFDATIVTRVLQAGGTIVGKNALDGFSGALSLGGSRGDYQRPLNPHDPSRVTGGSSSGSAVAVAAGEVDISFGGDQGGSIRIPAAWTGVVGLKPTFALVSHFGVGYATDPSIDHVGPLARTVEDVARALQAVAGYDSLDPRQGPVMPTQFDVLSDLGDGVEGLRIGILEEGFGEPIQPEVRDAVLAATRVLAEAGATVTRVSVSAHRQLSQVLPLWAEGGRAIFQTGFFGAFSKTYYPTALVVAVNKFWAHHADLLGPFAKLGHIVGEFTRRTYHGAAYAKAQNLRPAFVNAYDRVLEDVDMLIMPTCIAVAPEVKPACSFEEAIENELSVLKPNVTAADVSELSALELALRNMMQFNYTGHPALTVPCGKADGLPIGFQLVGRFFQDGLLLRAAAAYQAAVDWESMVGLPAAV